MELNKFHAQTGVLGPFAEIATHKGPLAELPTYTRQPRKLVSFSPHIAIARSFRRSIMQCRNLSINMNMNISKSCLSTPEQQQL